MDARKQPMDTLADKPGHCLWTGIADDDHADPPPGRPTTGSAPRQPHHPLGTLNKPVCCAWLGHLHGDHAPVTVHVALPIYTHP
ncbi:hypothetical protein [Streptomyces sp. NBC_01235]|uniref:hypothetical protein n=1 Tax=Streptomyces sp. NBC_01235 TaxID=2903788 RepID=UPI002E11D7D8|nr:hypothetical protein OG289_07240 [Streptomyces sp. NBC_01235]